VGFVVTAVCLAALQQFQVEPYPGEVGLPVTVSATRDGTPLAGLELAIELPDGSTRTVGTTDAAGRLEFVPLVVGQHVFAASVDGVRVLTPFAVIAAERPWLLALGTVPLGLALLWQLSRARGRRDP
jgi:hypothetical protein